MMTRTEASRTSALASEAWGADYSGRREIDLAGMLLPGSEVVLNGRRDKHQRYLSAHRLVHLMR